jgi:hypothetical protein
MKMATQMPGKLAPEMTNRYAHLHNFSLFHSWYPFLVYLGSNDRFVALEFRLLVAAIRKMGPRFFLIITIFASLSLAFGVLSFRIASFVRPLR